MKWCMICITLQIVPHNNIDNPDDVIKWKHFPHKGPFVRGIHRSSVNSPHKGQWRGALMFSLIWDWTNGWINKRDARDQERHRAHNGVTVMNPSKILLKPKYRKQSFVHCFSAYRYALFEIEDVFVDYNLCHWYTRSYAISVRVIFPTNSTYF